MPDLEGYEHLLDHLWSVGPAVAGEPVSFQEIKAWVDLTGVRVDGWEAEALRALSSAWVGEYRAADDAQRPPPFLSAPTSEQRVYVASALEVMFDQLASKGEKVEPKPPPSAPRSSRSRSAPRSGGRDNPSE